MSDDEWEALLRSYLDLTEHAPDSSAARKHRRAYDKVRELVEQDSAAALRLVATALRLPLSTEEDEFFAADALEDLLDADGPSVVGEIVAWAEHDERLRRMLSVAYHYSFNPEVSDQINVLLVRYGLSPWTGSVGGQVPLRPPA